MVALKGTSQIVKTPLTARRRGAVEGLAQAAPNLRVLVLC